MDGPAGGAGITDRDDASVVDGDIGSLRRVAEPVDHLATADYQIVHDVTSRCYEAIRAIW
jgi:hypothetical protein